MATVTSPQLGARDRALRDRAGRVIPAGMYGHQSAGLLWPGAPQFMHTADGSHVWDADGNRYLDLLCAYGPIILGYKHPTVEAAVQEQHRLLDCGNGPAAAMVELAERLVGVVEHADWAMFAKNGTDATTLCLTLARAHTRRSTILVAAGAYHGAAPWCTPSLSGVVDGDRAHLAYFRFNDLASVERAMRAHDGDVAGVIVSPFRHDAGYDQELPESDFAPGLRELCDRAGAVLILDEVRCGLRLAYGGSWEALGVRPDLSAWSKGIANGYPLAAVLGAEGLRGAGASVYATGSFWFAADAMAAALATLDVLDTIDGVAAMRARGEQLWHGLQEQASRHQIQINLTGHVTMPYLTFATDPAGEHDAGDVFAAACARRGVYIHPRHNWFISAAHTEQDIADALAATDVGYRAVAEYLLRRAA